MSGSTMHAVESGRSVCCTPSLKGQLFFLLELSTTAATDLHDGTLVS